MKKLMIFVMAAAVSFLFSSCDDASGSDTSTEYGTVTADVFEQIMTIGDVIDDSEDSAGDSLDHEIDDDLYSDSFTFDDGEGVSGTFEYSWSEDVDSYTESTSYVFNLSALALGDDENSGTMSGSGS
ncbi:MAG: hypothetical protein PQJ60_01415, partial [Spirochaetales bacterium]|nr:hypothetical protein [Spirochaetales bacterium]